MKIFLLSYFFLIFLFCHYFYFDRILEIQLFNASIDFVFEFICVISYFQNQRRQTEP